MSSNTKSTGTPRKPHQDAAVNTSFTSSTCDDSDTSRNQYESNLDMLRALAKVEESALTDLDLSRQFNQLGKCFFWTYDCDDDDIEWLSRTFPRERAFTPHIFEWAVAEIEINIRKCQNEMADVNGIISKMSNNEEIIQTCPDMRRLVIFVHAVKKYWVVKRKLIIERNAQVQHRTNIFDPQSTKGTFIIVFRPCKAAPNLDENTDIGLLYSSSQTDDSSNESQASTTESGSSSSESDVIRGCRGSAKLGARVPYATRPSKAAYQGRIRGPRVNAMAAPVSCTTSVQTNCTSDGTYSRVPNEQIGPDDESSTDSSDDQFVASESDQRAYRKLTDQFGKIIIQHSDARIKGRTVRRSMERRAAIMKEMESAEEMTSSSEDEIQEPQERSNQRLDGQEAYEDTSLLFHPTSVIMEDGRTEYKGIIRETIDSSGNRVTERYTGARGQKIGTPLWLRSCLPCQRNAYGLTRNQIDNGGAKGKQI